MEDIDADAELRELLTEALDTWDLYPLGLKKRVQILLNIFSRSVARKGSEKGRESGKNDSL